MLKRVTTTIALTAVCHVSYALPFASFDPRSMAMGGAGVAIAYSDQAHQFNPALLADNTGEFAMSVPTAGMRFNDSNNLVDDIQTFWDQNMVDRLSTAIDLYNNLLNVTSIQQLTDNMQQVADLSRNLSNDLQSVSDKPLVGELGFNLSVAIPGIEQAGAFSVTSWATGSGVGYFRDQSELEGVAADMETLLGCYQGTNNCSQITNLTYISPTGVVNYNPRQQLDSSLQARGINLLEFGLSYAQYFAQYDINLGVTPKYVLATLVDFTANIDTVDNMDITLADYTTTHHSFNMDLGASKTFKIPSLENGRLKGGVVIKNLIPQSYTSQFGNTVTIDPQLRAGLAYSREQFTVAADLDLTKNNPVAFEEASQFLSLGAEYNAASWAQLRAGYRSDLVNSNRSSFSAGLGLSPGSAHLDLAVAASSDRTDYGLSMQFSIRY